jgi:5-methylcytosine-specific restriction endonuclease McrA
VQWRFSMRASAGLDSLTYRQYLGTPRWRALAKAARKRDGYRCRRCRRRRRLDVHHTVYPDGWRWSEDSLANLVSLCRECHKGVHRRVYWPRVYRRVLWLAVIVYSCLVFIVR